MHVGVAGVGMGVNRFYYARVFFAKGFLFLMLSVRWTGGFLLCGGAQNKTGLCVCVVNGHGYIHVHV